MLKKPKNLMENAYLLIKSMIFQQKMGPGQKIICRDLSQKLNMSKTPILYALSRLEQEGFVELQPNLGYFVKEVDLKEIDDLFDVREALETHAITLAIKNQSDTDLKKLKEKIKEHKNYENPIYDRKRLVLDAEVHLQITKMSMNKVLVKQLHQIFEHLYLRYKVELMHPSRIPVAKMEHHQILAMIKKMDYPGADKVIRSHIQGAKQNMISSFSKEEVITALAIP